MTHSQELAALLAQATAHHQAGRLDVAESLYRAMLALDPDHAEANHHLGVLELESDRVEPGLTHLQHALEVSPETGHYWQSLAEALFIAQLPQEALRVIEQAMALGLDSTEAQALHTQLTSLPEIPQPQDPALDSPQQLVELIRTQRFQEAAEIAQRLAERDPSDPLGWRVLLMIHGRTGQPQAALKVVERALAVCPDELELFNSRGNILRALGRHEEALDDYRRVLAVAPSHAEAAYNMGLALHELGRLQEAVDSYRQALAHTPELIQAQQNLAAALAALGQRDRPEAAGD